MSNSVDLIRSELERAGPGSKDVSVAILDGVPDLDCDALRAAKIVHEAAMLPDTFEEPDVHGTEVCSLIFGREAGIAAECSGLILPIFFSDRRRRKAPSRASQMDIARALYIAADRGASVVNVSAGQKAATSEPVRHLEDALALCHRKRVLVVAAAGNDGCACLHVPAAVPTVLAVGAMDDTGRPIEQSNWGPSYADNGLLAPGANLDVVGPGGVRATRSGTSYATAIVSGVAARLLSVARREGFDLDALDIRDLLVDSADPCDPARDADCARVLAGRLNVSAALERLYSRGRTKAVMALSAAEQNPLMRGVSDMDATIAAAVTATGDSMTGVVEQQGCSCGGKAACSCEDKEPEAVKPQGDPQQARTSTRAAPAAANAPLVLQQGCGCNANQEAQLVYAIGALWFDFGSEARYDAIVQAMNDPVAANNPIQLISFLEEHLASASGITFVLLQDQIPIYAINPSGPFALEIYKAMLEAMRSSLDPTGDMQRVAVPGVVYGTTRLMNGMSVPVIYPDLRGMVKWRGAELAAAAKQAVSAAEAASIDDGSIFDFLVRVYDELRNLGLTPQERAMNFAATNAYQAATAFADGASRKLDLYKIAVKKSPICRPESDCWDVQLVMFDPENDRRAARFYRFTVDVSEVMPVTVGRMRSWNAPLVGI
jgi:cyanobactin maturation PatA/PatG family protease